MTAIYKKVRGLSAAEHGAATANGSESGFFHLAFQGDHSNVLAEFDAYGAFAASAQPLHLKSATSSCQLECDLTLYSGHGNGFGAVGPFGRNEPQSFVGMKWQYPGFTSTSLSRDVAERFVLTRAKGGGTPVFLEFRLTAGFRLLPMRELGPSTASEQEFLLPPNVPFVIDLVSRGSVGGVTDVLHFVLSAPK